MYAFTITVIAVLIATSGVVAAVRAVREHHKAERYVATPADSANWVRVRSLGVNAAEASVLYVIAAGMLLSTSVFVFSSLQPIVADASKVLVALTLVATVFGLSYESRLERAVVQPR